MVSSQVRQKALERHIKRLEQQITTLRQRSDTFSRWRLGIFLAAVVLTFIALSFSLAVGLLSGLLFLVVFVVVVRIHQKVDTTLRQFEIWRGLQIAQVARMALDWERLPQESVESPRGHPYSLDLDIIGDYSLHRLMDTSATQGGSERLKHKLLYPELNITTINVWQAIIAELRAIPTFRNRLALDAHIASGRLDKWEAETLMNWLRRSENVPVSRAMVLFLVGLSLLNIVLFLTANIAGLPPFWIVPYLLYMAVSSSQWSKLAGMFGDALNLQNQVNRVYALFQHVERYPYLKQPHLAALCAPFRDETNRPSTHLRRIKWITMAASIQQNLVLWIMLNLIVPWDITFGYLLSRSKGDLAQRIPGWLDILYELEALSSLANFAYLHPEHDFPTVTENPEEGVLQAEHIGHPMIPRDEVITNSFSFVHLGRLIILTGSNMSGKSSFLRTLGVNLILAYAGTITTAAMFKACTMRVYTSIRVSDSVVDGFSYFYAEVRRLRGLLEALAITDEHPVFFLIDEIFRGTNNRERLIGSRSLIRAMVDGHGVGLIATHDLELVKLADESDNIDNYHFREDVIDGRMAFDYTLRPGPSPTTNALTIMRLEGLPVEDDEPAV